MKIVIYRIISNLAQQKFDNNSISWYNVGTNKGCDNLQLKHKKNTKKTAENTDMRQELWSAARNIIIICLIIFFLAKVVFAWGIEQGSSMEPTFHNNDIYLSLRLGYNNPNYGDVVIVYVPNANHKYLIKRVIGRPGDTIEIDEQAGVVYRNGVPIDEPYTKEGTYTLGDMDGAITLGENQYFVMGDNRNHSTDSRFASVGPVTQKQIISKVFLHLECGPMLDNIFAWME